MPHFVALNRHLKHGFKIIFTCPLVVGCGQKASPSSSALSENWQQGQKILKRFSIIFKDTLILKRSMRGPISKVKQEAAFGF